MASQRTLSILSTLHSWAGLVSGVLLFLVCFSGAVLVFKHEIDRWGNPNVQVDAMPGVALAALLIWLALALGENKVKRSPRALRGAPPARPSMPAAVRVTVMLRLYAPFLLAAAVFVDGFRLAHLAPQHQLAGAGALGMLLAFFVLLPAASIRAWFPRSAATCFAIAAAAYGWLLAIAWNPLWAVFSCVALWLACRYGIAGSAHVNTVRVSEAT